MKIGFIGGGNMASAMIGGILSSGKAQPSDIMVSAKSQGTLDKLSSSFGIKVSLDNSQVASFADIVFLAVKPAVLYAVIDEIKSIDYTDKLVVSIAAGQSLSRLTEAFGKKLKLVRVMPNTPALVGQAMSAISGGDMVSDEELATVTGLFETFGKAELVAEKLQDVVTGISGSSPAYAYMFIEALADGAVAEGMPRAQAYKFAAQALLGSAAMVLETGQHPGALKDAVCSPGGTTIEAVATLEATGFRASVIEAERACIDKSRQL